MSVYMPKINYILLIYRNLFLTPIHASKLLLLNSLMEFLGTNTDIHIIIFCFIISFRYFFTLMLRSRKPDKHGRKHRKHIRLNISDEQLETVHKHR